MNYNGCSSLSHVDISVFDDIKCSKMIMLDTMNIRQIQWCAEKNLIANLKHNVAKQLGMCPHYAIIDSSLLDEFANIV